MAKLTAKKRKALPKKDSVFPGKHAYPINDKNHARNALARVAQHGSPSQKKAEKAAVKRKFPGIGKKKGKAFNAGGFERARRSHFGVGK